MVKFRDQDAEYVQWREDHHHDGWVMNCERNPGPGYLKLHRASCPTITVLQPKAKSWTHFYIKVCSTDRAEVESWARQIGPVTYCVCV